MLIDTSGWFCSLVEEDHRHSAAVALFASATNKVTHSYVIAELVALCDARKFSRDKTVAFVAELLDDPSIIVVWVDEHLTKEALDLIKGRPDKRWSLCDAVSFLIMKSGGLTEALTTDHHFEQAGFVQLLES